MFTNFSVHLTNKKSQRINEAQIQSFIFGIAGKSIKSEKHEDFTARFYVSDLCPGLLDY